MHFPTVAADAGECVPGAGEPGWLEARAKGWRERWCDGMGKRPSRQLGPDSRTTRDDTQQDARPSPVSQGRRAVSGLRVLVADAYRDGADSLALLLRLWGHEVRVARTGPQALAAALSWSPDVALVEVVLPELDGYRLARHLRGHGVVLVALSGQAGERHRRRCAEAGFALALVKPVDPEELRAVLGQLTEGGPRTKD